MTEETDNELMYLVRSGEVERLADLYDRYQGQLFGFFNGMTKNRVLSADLVQNGFPDQCDPANLLLCYFLCYAQRRSD